MAEPSETDSPQPFHLAVLMTCHNRRDTTLRCLEALFAQEGLPPELQMDVFLVDDGSTDGTGDAVRTRFPQVHVLQGDGNLYWAGGMRVAWEEAARTDPDSYLWLNDDTHLFPEALARFWGWHRRMGLQDRIGILVGSTCDPENGRFTYGGRRRISRLNAIATAQVPPSDTPVPCDTFNGNCLWLPRQAANRTGRLGEEFQHGMADYDYGFRAKNQGVPSWVLPGFIGDCTLNPKKKPWERPGLTLKARWEFITDPRGLPPLSWIRFSLRHGGWTGPLLAIKPYLDLFLYHILNKPNE